MTICGHSREGARACRRLLGPPITPATRRGPVALRQREPQRGGKRRLGVDRMRFEGRCHCGNLEVSFETERPPAQLPLRACTCSFCRRHGATTAADPAGTLEVRVREPSEVSRYRFALRTADFLVCRICGVYVAAICKVGDALFGTLNVNVLDQRAAFARTPEGVDYGAETAEERVTRRRRAWTPAMVRGLGV